MKNMTFIDPSVRTILENLKDAGCDSETVKRFFELDGEAKTGEQLELLSKQREQLLEKIHREEKKIDCLDYLVYQLNKKKKNAI